MVQCLTLFFGRTSHQEFKGRVFTAVRLLSHRDPGRPAKVEDAPYSDPDLPLSAGNTVDNILNHPQVPSLERLLRVKKRFGQRGDAPCAATWKAAPCAATL